MGFGFQRLTIDTHALRNDPVGLALKQEHSLEPLRCCSESRNSQCEPHVNGTSNVTYYFDVSHCHPGEPVSVDQNGGNGAVKAAHKFTMRGLRQLLQTINGIGVILKYRYYGASFPVAYLSTSNL